MHCSPCWSLFIGAPIISLRVRRSNASAMSVPMSWEPGASRKNSKAIARKHNICARATHSVLLAVFANDTLGQVVTLAQILWLEEKVHKLYFVAPCALTINDHSRLRGSPKDLRKHYRAQGIEVYDEFAKYSQHFRQLLSFRSEKALDLFNQIVSIKEIGSLNAFVREHMLEKMDAQMRIKQLQDNFANLTSAHDAIQLADRQLAILKPLMQDAQKYTELQGRIAETNRCTELLPMSMAQSKLALLAQAIANTQEQLRLSESSRLMLE